MLPHNRFGMVWAIVMGEEEGGHHHHLGDDERDETRSLPKTNTTFDVDQVSSGTNGNQ